MELACQLLAAVALFNQAINVVVSVWFICDKLCTLNKRHIGDIAEVM